MLLNNLKNPEYKSLREGFGKAILSLGDRHKDVIVLTADLASSTKTADFAKKFPNRFFQVGVAEQNLIGVGAGLALQGKIPFCCTFASFLQRAWEQIRVTVASQNLNVKLVGSHAGFSHPADGQTAQATEDLALMRVLPGMKVVYPADFNQMLKAAEAVLQLKSPCYLRMTREKTAVFISKKTSFSLGKAQVLKTGRDITIVSAGPLLHEGLLASHKAFKKGIDCEVINMHTIKPVDKKTLITSLKKTKRLLTVEDHQIQAGLGSAVLENVNKLSLKKVKLLGLDNIFSQTSRSYQKLLKEYKLDAGSIYKEILKFKQD
jgi:transketolase